ncbi:MAG TPA: hypothetical protein RMG95_24635, partial [Polyangiaceae bacterium LLY-WYZ-15_(1-7)]|nr:hypothetical protein [Polyangiaceae bacterium LLY-WYZ-15_(1-7)]
MQSATPEGRGGIGWGELGLEPAALDPAAERDLNGVRVILVASDPTTTDALAQQLRAHGAFVGVVDARGGGLARLAFLDPQVILAGRGEVGDAFRAALGESPRLRFAPILQIDWGGVWPPDAARPDLGALGQLVRPHASLDAALARKAREETRFRVPFERIGPARVLRALAGPSEDVLHLMLRAGEVRAIVEVCGDLVVGATWYGAGGERHVGARALAAVLGLRRAEAHVERRALARALTIMAPVGLALDAAEALRPSLPPPGTGVAPRGQGLDTLEHDLKGLARASARVPDSAAITAPVRLPEATAKHMTFALGDDEVTAKGPAAEVALGEELADWEDTTTERLGAGEGWDGPTAEEAPGWDEPTDRHPSVPPAVPSQAPSTAAVSNAGGATPPPPPPPPPPSAAARAAR